ncbi:MAG TPA: DNA-formamidopyrimidine glycosylase [Candidatus Saccharimonadales bacterium]|jgi:formamidopyrimidine-DNA glycosylase|nr:DNA-formamidopyrimidine glycosylase [Candidatus Saccharimonadales bacterium]
MPELPEVETVRIGLDNLIRGKKIASVTKDTAKSFPNTESDVSRFLIGASIVSIKRRAKLLIIGLSSNYSLVIHLKMTGQLVYKSHDQHFGAGHPSPSLVGQLPDKSTRVVFGFSDGSTLFFNDQRKFGWIRLLLSSEVVNIDFFKKVGPEPLAADFNWQLFRDRLKRRPKSAIKAVLLDQTVIAGIGNIYADESLWAAKIHPSQRVANLSPQAIRRLFDEIVAVLKMAIAKGGSTDRNYVNAEGKRGNYLDFAQVFRREGQLCLRCGKPIIKIRVAGRGTHICPACQRLR